MTVAASYSGTELAAQLRALADSAAKQMGFDAADVNFVLLDLTEQVMPEVGEKLGAAAMRVLTSRGIDVRLGVTLKEVHAEHVVLSDDSLIRTHTVAWVTGVTGAPLIEARSSRRARASPCRRRTDSNLAKRRYGLTVTYRANSS